MEVGDFRSAGIFLRYQIPCMNFFLGHSMNIFLGLIGGDHYKHFQNLKKVLGVRANSTV